MTEPGNRYWALVEPHWDRISIYDGEHVFLREFNNTPERARHLFAAHWCVSEVSNGGFHQFFSNGTGVLAPEAAGGFDAIGLPKLAGVVRRASAYFGIPYVRDQQARNDLLDQYEREHKEDWNPFEQLDDEFFDLITTECGGWETAADGYAEGPR